MTQPPPATKLELQTRYEAAMFDYAAGTLAAGPAFVVAAHLALKPESHALVDIFDAAGGSLLDELEPVELAPPSWLSEMR